MLVYIDCIVLYPSSRKLLTLRIGEQHCGVVTNEQNVAAEREIFTSGVLEKTRLLQHTWMVKP